MVGDPPIATTKRRTRLALLPRRAINIPLRMSGQVQITSTKAGSFVTPLNLESHHWSPSSLGAVLPPTTWVITSL